MQKSFLSLLVGLIFCLPLAAQSPDFDRLKSRFNQGLIFKAEFEHEFTDSYTGEVMYSSGNIFIDEDGYKLESDDQLLVVDDDVSRVYDSSRNRVIISDYEPEEDDFAPSRMLQGVDETYQITEEQTESGSRIILESDDDFAIFLRVEILLDENQNPLEITAFDISENVIVTSFHNGAFIPMEEDIFELDYPSDAEIVDLRN